MELPTFLDRKRNPTPPATLEERQAYAAMTKVQQPPPRDYAAELAAERKEKTAARIALMKARVSRRRREGASLLDNIPTKYLSWNARLCKFEDLREVNRRKEQLIMTMKQKIAQFNLLAKERNLPTRCWFKNLAAVDQAIQELTGNTASPPQPVSPEADPLPPLSNVAPTVGGRRLGGINPLHADGTPKRPSEIAMEAASIKMEKIKMEKEKKMRATTTKNGTAGQQPNARNFKPVRPGTVRATVLELMAGGTQTAEQIARKAGINAKQVMQHAYCTWRDAGIGYEIRGEKLKALFPTGVTLAKAIRKE